MSRDVVAAVFARCASAFALALALVVAPACVNDGAPAPAPAPPVDIVMTAPAELFLRRPVAVTLALQRDGAPAVVPTTARVTAGQATLRRAADVSFGAADAVDVEVDGEGHGVFFVSCFDRGDVVIEAEADGARAALRRPCDADLGLDLVAADGCAALMADGASSCRLAAVVTRDAVAARGVVVEIDVDGDVTDITTPDAEVAALGDANVLRPAGRQSAPVRALSLTTDDDGHAEFDVVSPRPLLEETLQLRARALGFEERRAVEIRAFADRSGIALEVPAQVASRAVFALHLVLVGADERPQRASVDVDVPDGFDVVAGDDVVVTGAGVTVDIDGAGDVDVVAPAVDVAATFVFTATAQLCSLCATRSVTAAVIVEP